MPDIPGLPKYLREQLARIAPSMDGTLAYHPTQVRLCDGRIIDRVYVVEADAYKHVWGIWPWEDAGKSYIPLEEIEDLWESPSRLPAALATRQYRQGESGMGYCIFMLVLSDGRRAPCVTGNAVDFPQLPDGVSMHDVVDLLPGEGREEVEGSAGRSPEYHWSFYRTSKM